MSQVIRMVSDLAKLPVGTKVLDKDGDVLRRAPEGWTYRNTDQLTNPGAVMHHRLLGQYMPMVTLDEPAPLAAKLSDPNLTEALVDLIQSRPNEPTQEDDYETVRLIRDTIEGWIPQP